VPVGAVKPCPPGFLPLADAPSPSQVASACAPDLDLCGIDPFAAVVDAPGIRFVDAAAAAGGDGTRAKPHRTLKEGLKTEPLAHTVVVAAGTYAESRLVGRSVTIRGRCAALVRLQGIDGQAAMWVESASTPATVHLVDVSVGGPAEAVVVAGGADVWLQRVHLLEAHGSGVLVQPKLTADQATAQVHMQDSVIADIAADPASGSAGHGLDIAEGATVIAQGLRVHQATDAAIRVAGKGASLTLTGAYVDSTSANASGEHGHGILVIGGGRADIADTTVAHARDVAVLAVGGGTHIAAAHLAVQDTQPRGATGEFGYGIELLGGATAQLSSTRLLRNRHVGLSVWGPVSSAELVHVDVEDTLPIANGNSGRGAQVGEFASLRWRDGQLRRNSEIGLAIHGGQVQLTGVAIAQTRPQALAHDLGRGIDAAAGASLVVVGGGVDSNTDVGVALWDATTVAHLIGVAIRNTAVREIDSQNGHGAVVRSGATIKTYGCVFAKNRTAALVAFEGSAVLDRTAVVATQMAAYAVPGEATPRQLADGIVAFKAPFLELRDSLVASLARAAILVDGAAKVTLVRTGATQAAFGLAVQSAPAPKEDASLFWNNVIANRALEQGLSVPPPPQPVKLP